MKNDGRRTILMIILIGLSVTGLVMALAQCGEIPSPRPGAAPTEPAAATLMRIPTETAPLAPPSTPAAMTSPGPTPMVIQVTGANEVALATENFVVEGLYGNMAVGITAGEKNQVLLVDLATGRVHRLDSSVDAKYRTSPCISERWVVWVENFVTPDGQYTGNRLVAYDLKLDHEFQVPITKTTHGIEVTLSGDIVVWSEIIDYYSSGSDIFARNLATEQGWTVAAGPNDQWSPRVSGQWVIYLDEEEGAYSANLRAHYLPTGEDFVIGQLPSPPDSSAGKYHALAGHKVVWIKYQPDPVSQLHVYDLETRADRPLVLGDGRQIWKFLDLFGEDALLKWGTIYSLESGAVLGTLDTAAVEGSVYRVYVSGNRVTLSTVQDTASGSVWRLYTLQLGR
ncbi:MAG: hypothetical protein ACP5NB_01660 [Chloroflexia bacterium]